MVVFLVSSIYLERIDNEKDKIFLSNMVRIKAQNKRAEKERQRQERQDRILSGIVISSIIYYYTFANRKH